MLKVTLQRKRSESPVWLSHLILTPHSHPYTPQKGGSSFVSQTFHCLFSVLQLGTHNQKQHQVNECSWDRGRGREHSSQVSLWARRQQVNPRILLGPPLPQPATEGDGTEGAGDGSVLGLWATLVGVTNLMTLFLLLSPCQLLNWENSYKTGLRFPYQKEKGPPQGRSYRH